MTRRATRPRSAMARSTLAWCRRERGRMARKPRAARAQRRRTSSSSSSSTRRWWAPPSPWGRLPDTTRRAGVLEDKSAALTQRASPPAKRRSGSLPNSTLRFLGGLKSDFAQDLELWIGCPRPDGLDALAAQVHPSQAFHFQEDILANRLRPGRGGGRRGARRRCCG